MSRKLPLLKIDRRLKVYRCFRCNGRLEDAHFQYCGIYCHDGSGLFLDYKCGGCGFFGRYILPALHPMPLEKLLDLLAKSVNRKDLPWDSRDFIDAFWSE